MYLGIRSVIYPAPDITAARDWFADLLDIQPYFDEPFYVGSISAATSSALRLVPTSRGERSPIGALRTRVRRSKNFSRRARPTRAECQT